MKVALYYPWVYLRSGVERMIVELVSRSRHEWVIYTSHYYPEQTFPEFKKLNIIELSKVSVSRGYSAVGGAAVTILNQKINLDEYDALVVSSEGLGDFITFRNHSIPVICYCHTPLKVIHDEFIKRKYLKENPRSRPLFYIFSSTFKFFDKLAWKKYQHVFCNSNEVKNRIMKAGLTTEDRVEILSPGLDTTRMIPSGVFQKYFVVVGRIKWWKNLELAIESFKEFKRKYPKYNDFELHIAGLVEKGSESYFARLLELADGDTSIVFQRDIDEKTLMEAYRSSYCLLLPSLNEDWGMTVLEAMGFGKPVIAVGQGGPAESIVDGETGFLVEPKPEAFADAMAVLASDPDLTRRFGDAGSKLVKKYDWSHFVERFDSYLDSLQK